MALGPTGPTPKTFARIGVYLDHYMQRALIFDMNFYLVDPYQVNEMSPGSKMAHYCHMFYTGLYSLNIKKSLDLNC